LWKLIVHSASKNADWLVGKAGGAYNYHYVLMCIFGLYLVIWTAVKRNVKKTVENCCNGNGIEVRGGG
jgi:hypothetical protein